MGDSDEPTMIGAMIESLEADLQMSDDINRLAFRAVLRWAMEDNRLYRCSNGFEVQYCSEDGVVWDADRARNPGERTAYVESGNFIQIEHWRATAFVRIERYRGSWWFHVQRSMLPPLDFLKMVCDSRGYRSSDLLFTESQKRDKRTPHQWLALSCLKRAREMSDSAVLIPFKIFVKDNPTDETLDIARLIRATQWLGTQIQEKNENKSIQKLRTSKRTFEHV